MCECVCGVLKLLVHNIILTHVAMQGAIKHYGIVFIHTSCMRDSFLSDIIWGVNDQNSIHHHILLLEGEKCNAH